MSTDQREITGVVLEAVQPFLGGPVADGEGWRFEFGEHLHSNWGAVYGGALAAGMLAVGRSLVPERSPRSMHLQILRPVPSGASRATTVLRHQGRTVATVEVNLHDGRGKLASIALLTMVSPEALAADYDRPVAAPAFNLREATQTGEHLIPGSAEAPIVKALNLAPRGIEVILMADNVRAGVDGSTAPVIECTVPWDAPEHTGPEAACLIADSAVAVPVEFSSIPSSAIGPNPDLTLRFSTAPATRVIHAASTLGVRVAGWRSLSRANQGGCTPASATSARGDQATSSSRRRRSLRSRLSPSSVRPTATTGSRSTASARSASLTGSTTGSVQSAVRASTWYRPSAAMISPWRHLESKASGTSTSR